MKANILLVDEARSVRLLRALLEGSGFRCFRVRGPLKLRAFLAAEPVDLVVWHERAGQPALAEDLAAELERHPRLPVVHLYPNAPAPGHGLGDSPLRESLPAASADTALIPTVERLLGEVPEIGSGKPLDKTELAFRHVVSRLRQRWGSGSAPTAPEQTLEPLRVTGTALEPTEREALFSSNSPHSGPRGRKHRLTDPLRRILSFFRSE